MTASAVGSSSAVSVDTSRQPDIFNKALHDSDQFASFFNSRVKGWAETETRSLFSVVLEMQEEISGESLYMKKEVMIIFGASGAGKTGLLQAVKKKLEEEWGCLLPYTDRDICLRKLSKIEDIALKHRIEASSDLRYVASVINHLIIVYLIEKGCTFLLRVNSSDKKISQLFEYFKKNNYEINVFHLATPDRIRDLSIRNRDGGYKWISEDIILESGHRLTQSIKELLRYSHSIWFCYRGNVHERGSFGAVFGRTKAADGRESGFIRIKDLGIYQKIVEVHNGPVGLLERSGARGFSWEDTVVASSAYTELQVI